MAIQDAGGIYEPASNRYQDEAGNPIVPGRKLGEGGEGAVYLLDGAPGSVVKIWHPDRIPLDADARIWHMVNNPVTPGPGVAWSVSWPQRMVMENGAIAGYTMPILAPSEAWASIIEYANLSAAQRIEAEQERRLLMDDRVSIARNLAWAFNAVHAAGYVIGDVNEKCVEVNRQNDVALMDCDSYGFTDPATGQTFTNNMGRPEFQAPEAQGNYANRTQEQDLFALAILIFQLLTGYHPYTVTGQHAQDYTMIGDRITAWLFPPAGPSLTAHDPYHEAWDALTGRQQELFLRCFDKAHEGEPRPTPAEWAAALGELEQETDGIGVYGLAEFYDNPEDRCSLVLMLDVSGSMGGLKIDTVNRALANFRDNIREDPLTALRTDVAIIEFDHEARVVMGFTNGTAFEPPALTVGGGTNYSAAVNLALDMIEARKQIYRDSGIAYYRSLAYFLTDGYPERDTADDLAEAAARLQQEEENRNVAFFAFAINSADYEMDLTELAKLASPNRPPKELTNMEQLAGCIQWLSHSVAAVSQSQPGDSIRLPEQDFLNR